MQPAAVRAVLLVAVLLALAAGLFPESVAGHHRGYWAPPPPPPTPVPAMDVCDLCNRPDVPPVVVVPAFRGLSAVSAAAAAAGSTATAGSTSTTSAAAAECVAPLSGLSTACGAFLTRSDPETPAPQSECCAALVAFVNSSSSSTSADGDGDRDLALRCMSPLILRHANELLERPLDPTRMMYLPMQCGVVFPPETLYVCLTGQQRPPLVSRIPDQWENPV